MPPAASLALGCLGTFLAEGSSKAAEVVVRDAAG
jgi:hypothetical protein